MYRMNLSHKRSRTRILETSANGTDSHRHGCMVMRVETNTGTLYYKPRNCRLGARAPLGQRPHAVREDAGR